MSARSKARKRALDILFEADSKSVPLASVTADTIRRRDAAGDPPLNEHTVALVEGIAANQAVVDSAIEAAAEGWTVARMPAVDRAILRIGAYEILFADDVPTGVAISEAVELATSLSTDESPAFVNGVLSGVDRKSRVEG
jgi:transcription antitermination protein NusB